MSHASLRRLLFSFAAVALAISLAPGVATAQSAVPNAAAPNAMERAIILDSPAVVFLDTSVTVRVVLVYRNANAVSGLGSLRRTYSFDYSTGSGFVVNPNGVVITASHVVEPDQQSMHNYAANRLVLEGFGWKYPSKSSTPYTKYKLPVGWENVLLQQCYRGVACRFTVTPSVTVFSAVDIAQTQLPHGSPARILTSTGFNKTDVAVLQTNGTNMATVPLAATAMNLQSGDEITALGFPGTSRDSLQTGVTQPNKVFGRVSNIRQQGTSNLIEVDASIEHGMSGGPGIDSQGNVVGLISFSLIQSTGEAGAKYLRTVDDIKTAMSTAGVQAARGPTDTAFQSAMTNFWGHHYSASVPLFQKVLALSDGSVLAKQYLAQAQTKAGTAADIPLVVPTTEKASKSFPVWAIGAIAGGVLVIVVVLLLVLRRKRPAPAPAQQAIPAAPVTFTAPLISGSNGFEPKVVGFQPPPAPSPQPPAPAGAPATSGGSTLSPVAEASRPAEVGMQFCPDCGQPHRSGTRFCEKCGAKIGG